MARGKIIIGHRGIPSRAHENTMDSFLKAIRYGADMVELDIRMTADRIAVAFHDPEVVTSQGSLPLSLISFENLNSIAQSRGFSIPTVSEIIGKLSGRTRILFEFKESGYEKQIVQKILDGFPRTDVSFQSFNIETVHRILQTDSCLETGFLICKDSQLNDAAGCRASFLAPCFDLLERNRHFFETQKRNGKRIAVWTVDSAELITELMNDRIPDMLITNRCDLATRIRRRLKK
ncbi:MAG: glycerophosphodiester phosphodiesterase [Chitinispirillaceae bacterium]